ncbi:MAG: Nif3-like dinuclear metal center hexameric protein [Thermomicrobiales bacterium]
MTAELNDIVRAINAYLDPGTMTDYCVNGLQVEGGNPIIERIAVGVSANMTLFDAAAAWGAQAVLVHHGLFWFTDDPETDPARPIDNARAAFLRANGMSLLAWHLPLDAHPEVGNNAGIARRLDLTVESRDFACMPEGGPCIGLIARTQPGIPVEALADRCRRVFGQEPIVTGSGKPDIERVAIVSGGGAGETWSAIARGVDAYISGEGREWIPGVAREAGLHFLAIGHHASETWGIQDLATWVERRFEVETRFFPQDNVF